jgi:hypothetical protein
MGLTFDRISIQCLVNTLLKYNFEEWQALCELPAASRDEVAKLIYDDGTLNQSRRRVLISRFRSRGVDRTPELCEKIEVSILVPPPLD